MDNSISFIFGIPQHGWLPVDLHYNNFHLEFDASGILNDPTEELFNLVTKIQDNEARRITWWFEPGAYFFDFEKKGQDFTLTIFETGNLHNQNAENKQLTIISGNEKQIIEPFRSALRHFFSQTFEETQWPYNLDKKLKQRL